MPGTGFTVEPNEFVSLSPERAVSLFRHLLWAEADRVGIGRHVIDVPDCINVGDGGVDAYIENVAPSNDDVVPQGSSVFQVKATDMAPKACRRELHSQNDLCKPLKKELEKRLQQGSAYVLVLMADKTNALRRSREEALREELTKCGYEHCKVRVYMANQLAGFTNRHPSLVVSLRPELSNCVPYEKWGTLRDVRHPARFVPDSHRKNLVELVARTLRERKACPVIRIVGLPGVGKTRFSFEGLEAEDLKHQVLYVQRAADLIESQLFYALVNDTQFSAILVVDECDLEQHRSLTNAFANQGSRLALITLSHEMGLLPPPTNEIHVEPLERETIEEILKLEHPGLPTSAIRRLAEFADGYPYIAVLLAGQQEAEGHSESYLSISDDLLMNRLIGGSIPPESDFFNTTKDVLTGLSLFHRIGVKGKGEIESHWLAERFNVPLSEFQKVLNRQKERGIIQGEAYVSVTPFMLRIHLLEEWWETHGLKDEASFEEFVMGMPEVVRADLLHRFLEHFPYVASAPRGAEFVKKMLAEGGILSNYRLLSNNLGSRLFFALAEADPASALTTAQRVIGERSREELLEFRVGRREMIEALSRMAVWKKLFQPAASLLLSLAEAETESWANNATGVLVGFFRIGTGPAASTETPYPQRLPILQEALWSDSTYQRKLGIQACRCALDMGSYNRILGPEWQGVRREPDLWKPATYGELFDAYRSVWSLTRKALDHLDGEEWANAVDVLVSSARGLNRFGSLVDMVIETIRDLASVPKVDRRELVGLAAKILHYDKSKLEPETLGKWEGLQEDLSGNDFESRMLRYVSMDLLVDQFDEKGKKVNRAKPQLEELASLAIESPSLLNAELHWLVTKLAKSGNNFGYELGKRDLGYIFLPSILASQDSAGDDSDLSFTGAYLRAMAERDPEDWELLLDSFCRDSTHAKWVVQLTWRSGRLTERRARRVLDLVRTGTVTAAALRVFKYGALVRSLSSDLFGNWVDVLLETNQLIAVTTALDLTVTYFSGHEAPLPKEPVFRVLSHQAWFTPTAAGFQGSAHDMFWWSRTAASLCEEHPNKAIELARMMLTHLGETGTVVEGFDEEPLKVLDVAMEQQPERIWRLASSMLGPPVDSRAFHIANWLGKSEIDGKDRAHILEFIPRDPIWKWVDADPEFRSGYLATFVPKVMRGPQDAPCLAREVLLRYGLDPRVRSSLISNFSGGVWRGPLSQHLAAKKTWLQVLRNQETHPNVILWIDEYDKEISQEGEFARQEEERRGW